MMGEQFSLDDWLARRPQFPGSDDASESERLTGQIRRVFDAVKDGRLRTLGEIAALTGDPPASVAVQLRLLKRLGGCSLEKRLRGLPKPKLWEYRLSTRRL